VLYQIRHHRPAVGLDFTRPLGNSGAMSKLNRVPMRTTQTRRGVALVAAAAVVVMFVRPSDAQPATVQTPAAPTASIAALSATNREAAEAILKQALKVEQTGKNSFRIGRVEFDKLARTVTLPARVHLRTQIVEYVLVTETGKAYESLLTTDARPTDAHLAFLLLGATPTEVKGDFDQPAPIPAANAVSIEVSWQTRTNGATQTHPLAELVLLGDDRPDARPNRPFPASAWLFNGSAFDETGFVAQREGSIISLIRDEAALVNNPRADRDNHHVHWPNAKLVPPENWPVRITFHLPPRPAG
jgi:hypothetical protein